MNRKSPKTQKVRFWKSWRSVAVSFGGRFERLKSHPNMNITFPFRFSARRELPVSKPRVRARPYPHSKPRPRPGVLGVFGRLSSSSLPWRQTNNKRSSVRIVLSPKIGSSISSISDSNLYIYIIYSLHVKYCKACILNTFNFSKQWFTCWSSSCHCTLDIRLYRPAPVRLSHRLTSQVSTTAKHDVLKRRGLARWGMVRLLASNRSWKTVAPAELRVGCWIQKSQIGFIAGL